MILIYEMYFEPSEQVPFSDFGPSTSPPTKMSSERSWHLSPNEGDNRSLLLGFT